MSEIHNKIPCTCRKQMIDVVEKNQKLAISALGHYVERLKKIEADDEITLVLTEPL